MTRNRRTARDSGARWESAIVDYCRDHGYPLVERRARRGALDAGDIAGLPTVVEAKDCAAITLAAFVAEANAEAQNAGVDVGVAWIKRRGQSSPGAGYVLLDGAAFIRLLRSVK